MEQNLGDRVNLSVGLIDKWRGLQEDPIIRGVLSSSYLLGIWEKQLPAFKLSYIPGQALVFLQLVTNATSILLSENSFCYMTNRTRWLRLMIKLFVFRHAETFDNNHEIFSGWRDSKLTLRGTWVDEWDCWATWEALHGYAFSYDFRQFDWSVESPRVRAIKLDWKAIVIPRMVRLATDNLNPLKKFY